MEDFMPLLSTMISPTAEQLFFVILIIVLPIVLLWAKAKKEKLKEPVMERGRDKGRLAIGKRDYRSSDVTTVALQETMRE